jgi:hypothetical protein
MAKTNISMPDGLLAEIDRRAEETKTTRSGFIQEAAAHYIAALDADKARAERAERIDDAARMMAQIGERIGQGPDAVTLLRQARSAPPRWLAAPASRDCASE